MDLFTQQCSMLVLLAAEHRRAAPVSLLCAYESLTPACARWAVASWCRRYRLMLAVGELYRDGWNEYVRELGCHA